MARSRRAARFCSSERLSPAKTLFYRSTIAQRPPRRRPSAAPATACNSAALVESGLAMDFWSGLIRCRVRVVSQTALQLAGQNEAQVHMKCLIICQSLKGLLNGQCRDVPNHWPMPEPTVQ